MLCLLRLDQIRNRFIKIMYNIFSFSGHDENEGYKRCQAAGGHVVSQVRAKALNDT